MSPPVLADKSGGRAAGLPTISIVTPSLDQAAYLPITLASVLDQGYPALEYVVVDGESGDGSVEIIRSVAERLSWWVSEPDAGHADALNKGFVHTGGEIMAWLNSSDVYYPWTLATVAAVFRDLPQVEWLVGVPSELGELGGPCAIGRDEWNLYDVLGGDYRWIQQESVFWRRRLWERVGGRLDDSLTYTCDFDLWLRFLEAAPLYHVPTLLGGFRQHGDRLGAGEGGTGYGREAAELLRRLHERVGARDARRGRFVHLTGGRRGRLPRKALHQLGLLPWYRHERVKFDFGSARWRVI
jgi:glycosyltransferase involved in cell wall biosynthesis